MVRTPDADTYITGIIARVLPGDSLAPFLSIIFPNYVLRISVVRMKENNLTLKKARGWQYHAKTTTDADYVDYLRLLAYTCPSEKFL